MKMNKSKEWNHQITGVDGNCQLFRVNIFKYDWESTGERVKIKDPLYNQEHVFNIYEVTINSKCYKFAAGEFSNCVWGFYTFNY